MDVMETASTGNRQKLISSGAIDCDVHPHFRSGVMDLGPYLDEAWRSRIGVGQEPWAKGLPAASFQLPVPAYNHPGTNLRPDTVSPDGSPPASDPAFTAQDLLERYDLRAAVLVGGNVLALGGLPDPDLAAAIASAYNDWLVETWLNTDERYWGSLVVAPQEPVKAAEEIARCASNPSFVQIFISNNGMALGKRHFYPIYEAAEHYGLPIGIHPGGEASSGVNGHLTALDPPTYYIAMHTAMDQVYQAHVISLVTEGVFERFPTLKVGLIETGYAWLPAVMWKLDKNWKGLRREVPWVKRLPTEYIHDHIRISTQPMYEPPHRRQLDYLFEMINAEDILMFSTDYPHWDGDDPNTVLRAVSPDLRTRILSTNAEEFYRLPAAVRQSTLTGGAEDE